MLSAVYVTLLAVCQLAAASILSCPEYQFACSDGNCIEKNLMCDGVKNCVDGSDETFKACYNTTCEERDLHRCNYGGCVAKDLVCNNHADCWDKSDENKYVCANDTQFDELFIELLGPCGEDYAVVCDQDRRRKCLKWSQICDGHKDCSDGTDESMELCTSSSCPPDSFRCENGACINQKSFCNREIDCADGSDEIPDICRTSVAKLQHSVPKDIENGPTTPKNIEKVPSNNIDTNKIVNSLLPPSYIENIPWTVIGCRLEPKPGMRVVDYFSDFSYRSDAEVPVKTVVSMTCDKGYESFGSGINKCDDSIWAWNYFGCVRVCKQSVDERNTRFVTQCILNDGLADCKQNNLLLDTKMFVTCAPGFQADNEASKVGRHSCNETGLWFTEDANPNCKAICGIKSTHHPEITPWTVSIFQRVSTDEDTYNFRCSGTILSPYVILTAENCFIDHNYRQDNHLYYSVVEGDHRISYKPSEEHGYNLHNISQIHIVSYHATQKVALLTLVRPFKFGAKVRPICLDTTEVEGDVAVESPGDFSQYQKGHGLNVFENNKYSLTHLVVNDQMSYNIKAFVKPIGDDIVKSERIS